MCKLWKLRNYFTYWLNGGTSLKNRFHLSGAVENRSSSSVDLRAPSYKSIKIKAFEDLVQCISQHHKRQPKYKALPMA